MKTHFICTPNTSANTYFLLNPLYSWWFLIALIPGWELFKCYSHQWAFIRKKFHINIKLYSCIKSLWLWVHAKAAHEGNVARPGGKSQLVGWSVRAGSRTITAVTYHHSVWLRQWHSRTPQGKNEASIQLVSQDQAGHARNDKTICWAQ